MFYEFPLYNKLSFFSYDRFEYYDMLISYSKQLFIFEIYWKFSAVLFSRTYTFYFNTVKFQISRIL